MKFDAANPPKFDPNAETLRGCPHPIQGKTKNNDLYYRACGYCRYCRNIQTMYRASRISLASLSQHPATKSVFVTLTFDPEEFYEFPLYLPDIIGTETNDKGVPFGSYDLKENMKGVTRTFLDSLRRRQKRLCDKHGYDVPEIEQFSHADFGDNDLFHIHSIITGVYPDTLDVKILRDVNVPQESSLWKHGFCQFKEVVPATLQYVARHPHKSQNLRQALKIELPHSATKEMGKKGVLALADRACKTYRNHPEMIHDKPVVKFGKTRSMLDPQLYKVFARRCREHGIEPRVTNPLDGLSRKESYLEKLLIKQELLAIAPEAEFNALAKSKYLDDRYQTGEKAPKQRYYSPKKGQRL